MSLETSTTLPKNQRLYAMIILLILMGGTLYAAIISIEPPTPDKVSEEGQSYLRFGKNVQVTSVPQGNNEPSIAVDPLDPMHIVAAGNDYGTPASDAWVGYYVSWDGGKNWSRGLIPGYPGGSISPSPLNGYKAAGDPVVVFDGQGNVYISGIAFKRSLMMPGRDDGIFVAKSTDGGESFDQVRMVINSMHTLSAFHDKEWMAIDQRNGNIYVVWAWFIGYGAIGSQVLFSRSTNGGQTWSIPRIISDVRNAEFGIQGSTIQVDNDGTIHVAWIDFDMNQVRYAYSTDSGQSFSIPVSISEVRPIDRYIEPNNDYRTPTLLMSAVDLGDSNYSGSLYITWNDVRYGDSDILLIYRRDGGQTWSEPVRVNNDTLSNGHDQFFSAVSVSPEGYVHLVFYDRRDDVNNTLIRAYYAISTNGGEDFSINIDISDEPFDGNNAPGSEPFIGDYIGIAATNMTTNAIWCDTRDGTPESKSSDLYFAAVEFEKILEEYFSEE